MTDVRKAVYCTSVNNGDDSTWGFFWERYQLADFETEQSTILSALGCTKNSTVLEGYLSLVLSGEVPEQSRDFAFNSILEGDSENVEVVLGFIEENNEEWALG